LHIAIDFRGVQAEHGIDGVANVSGIGVPRELLGTTGSRVARVKVLDVARLHPFQPKRKVAAGQMHHHVVEGRVMARRTHRRDPFDVGERLELRPRRFQQRSRCSSSS
jgi:hypothetical protein